MPFFGRNRDRVQIWSQAGLAILILALFAFMISRTGNDNPAGVSSVELAFRSLLEKILIVRPRTKEFLIGHPAMIVAIATTTDVEVTT